MRIYHGSKDIIECPKYGYGKKNNDYGLGFYCTESVDLAMEWAVDSDRDGYANQYDIELDNMKVLDLTEDNICILEWMAILLENREFAINSPIAYEAKKYILNNFLPNYMNYDVIKGYRADDSYFSFARDFLNNTISLEQLNEAMHYGSLGEQIVLKSSRAFDELKYVEHELVRATEWFPKKENRDSLARRKYYDMEKNLFRRGETYVIKIIDEELKKDDIRI